MPTIFISDADRGIAPELARQYADEGWAVIVTAQQPDDAPDLQALADEYADVELYALDVTDRDAVMALAWKLDGRSIDILVSNAGVMSLNGSVLGALPQKMCGLDFPEWEEMFRVNTLAPVSLAEAFADLVATSGEKKIVALSSRLASIGDNSDGAYYAHRSTTAALNAAMKSMAIDLADSGIACAIFHPDRVGEGAPSYAGAAPGHEAAENVAALRRQIAALNLDSAGRFLGSDGQEIPW